MLLRGYGLSIENMECIVFDLCTGEEDIWSVEVWLFVMYVVVFFGESLIVIECYMV